MMEMQRSWPSSERLGKFWRYIDSWDMTPWFLTFLVQFEPLPDSDDESDFSDMDNDGQDEDEDDEDGESDSGKRKARDGGSPSRKRRKLDQSVRTFLLMTEAISIASECACNTGRSEPIQTEAQQILPCWNIVWSKCSNHDLYPGEYPGQS
jgi:hypothetical protein